MPSHGSSSTSSDSASAAPSAATPGEPSRGSLLVVFLTVFIDLLGFGLVLPLLPIYADQFAVDPHGWQLGALMASFSVMQLIFAPIWGLVSDRIGRRPVLLIGLAASVVFYSLFGIAASWGSLALIFVSRIGAGIAGATIPTAQAYIADCTPPEKRARGMALIGMAFGMGFTFGPLLGLVAVLFGGDDPGPWPGYVAAALSAAALVLGWLKLPESLHARSATAVRSHFAPSQLRAAARERSIPLLLLAIFVCVFSFANFETTLSLLLKGTEDVGDTPFRFGWNEMFLTFAFIGFVLALIQGGIVRPLSKRIPEVHMATAGALLEVVGFSLVTVAVSRASTPLLFLTLLFVVTGFACMQPSLNSLLSRRTSPERQGAVLGVGQSVNALARIVGSGLGIPLLKADLTAPYWTAAALMLVGAVLVLVAVRTGKDYGASETGSGNGTSPA